MFQTRTLVILVFDDVEVLDFCGPFEVFSVANRFTNPTAFNVLTVAEKARPVMTRGGLSVNPHHWLADRPPPNSLLVLGGQFKVGIMAPVEGIKEEPDGFRNAGFDLQKSPAYIAKNHAQLVPCRHVKRACFDPDSTLDVANDDVQEAGSIADTTNATCLKGVGYFVRGSAH